jgi:hypothetical protein
LADARRFILSLEPHRQFRNEWQNAAGKLLAAAEGGSLDEARAALRNALFLNMMLDLSED